VSSSLPNQTRSAIQSILDECVADDSERGVQVAVFHQGELIVDAFAGVADAATGRRVTRDTLFPAFSTTKGIAATLIHLLVERGQLSYDMRIAEVWPEFGIHGKEEITLRQALNHTAGLPLMPLGVGHAELGNWETMCSLIAELRPISLPGAETAYHAITYGWLIGEVAQRVDGRPFCRLLHEEISVRLGLTSELYVGIPDEAEPRVAILEGPEEEPVLALADEEKPEAIPALVRPLHRWMNRPDARRACLPASNGIMTARAIARHYAALLPGGVDGVELLPPERVRLAIEPQPAGDGGDGGARRLGYAQGLQFSSAAFGHGGYGGSLGFADPESGVAFGFVRNRFVSETTLPRILEALRMQQNRS
jgi:CubicO group peptidase (beta-lactamase class C family)